MSTDPSLVCSEPATCIEAPKASYLGFSSEQQNL
uniref:Uncharacterized protein n=1 Tax=Arundo donax TaxID=35708 RepID=A0A0A9AZT1_ARUDO